MQAWSPQGELGGTFIPLSPVGVPEIDVDRFTEVRAIAAK